MITDVMLGQQTYLPLLDVWVTTRELRLNFYPDGVPEGIKSRLDIAAIDAGRTFHGWSRVYTGGTPAMAPQTPVASPRLTAVPPPIPRKLKRSHAEILDNSAFDNSSEYDDMPSLIHQSGECYCQHSVSDEE
jgi:hypothetical protein